MYKKILFWSFLCCLCAAAVAAQPFTSDAYRNGFWYVTVPARPDKGFYHGYGLMVPQDLNKNQKHTLLVDLRGRPAPVFFEYGHEVGRLSGAPVLLPFWPQTSAAQQGANLNSAAMAVTAGSAQRLDLQLLAMGKDARKLLKTQGFKTHDKFFIYGPVPAGTFCARFTALHPKSVQAAVCGSADGTLWLPQAPDGAALPYPLGAAGVKELTGKNFNQAAWKRVPQFWYRFDPFANLSKTEAQMLLLLLPRAARGLGQWHHEYEYTPQERQTIRRVLGDTPSKRWAVTQQTAQGTGAALQTYTYRRFISDEPRLQDAAGFFRANAGGAFTPTWPQDKPDPAAPAP